MRDFWKSLKSIRLAIALIGVIAAGSLVSTLIPQTGSNRYFSSSLFLVPGVLFFFNLGACTIDRLIRELRKKSRRRHGPDILHIGLLLLIVGGLASSLGRKEGTVMLAKGESVDLPGGEVLTLVSFSEARYDDGRPKDWTSLVNLEKSGKRIYSDREIRVNKPLRLGGVTLYQASYDSEMTVELKNAEGRVFSIPMGRKFREGDTYVYFMTVEHGADAESSLAAVLRVGDAKGEKTLRVGQDAVFFGAYQITVKEVLQTGIKAVRDPGYPFVALALILIGVGTSLTFFQKLKEMNFSA